jgi:hypothetical protein
MIYALQGFEIYTTHLVSWWSDSTRRGRTCGTGSVIEDENSYIIFVGVETFLQPGILRPSFFCVTMQRRFLFGCRRFGKPFSWTALSLKIWPAGPEMSVTNYYPTLPYIPAELRPQLHSGGRLTSRAGIIFREIQRHNMQECEEGFGIK